MLAGGGAAETPVSKPKAIANLRQIMRSIALPNSNVIFDVQSRPPKDEMEWMEVENAAMAIAEFANLVTVPGRLRGNGQPAPVQRADWNKFAEGLVEAGKACYRAAHMKSQDAVSKCSDRLSDSCSNCHDVYRDRPQTPAAAKKK